MDLIFQFLRIMVFCFAGELCHNFLPLPIPASVYGLLLLLAALKLGWVKPEQVRTAALFLIGIFPLLFVPAAAGDHGPVGGASRHAAARVSSRWCRSLSWSWPRRAVSPSGSPRPSQNWRRN